VDSTVHKHRHCSTPAQGEAIYYSGRKSILYDLNWTPNIHAVHTLALQILFSSNKTATLVKVRSGQADYFLTARKEIISSAGAFQFPQLLIVSGIGPSQTLAQHNISLVADRPGVGQDMWDPIDIEVTWKVGVVGSNALANLTYATEQAQLFHDERSSTYGNYGADYIG
jgi:choline dehydrogenase-like flavoprotein